jgi:hypothetical protein
MKLIAHRGLIAGANPGLENRPEQIEQVLAQGYEAEIDVWLHNGDWWLGHDHISYRTSIEFLQKDGLWIHTKNFAAADGLLALINQGWNFNIFAHDRDERTLTSHGFWWTYPKQQLGKFSIAVMPEWHIDIAALPSVAKWNCAGVCSDWVGVMKPLKKEEE